MSESYVTQGTIHTIGATTEYGQNGFTKREFTVLLSGEGENPEFKNYVQFSLMKDKCALMDAYQVGNELKITFNLGGRLWEGNGNGEKCFVDLQAWKVELLSIGQQQAPTQQAPQQAPPQQAPQAAPQQEPPQRNIEALIIEYRGLAREGQLAMWSGLTPAEKIALSAAIS